MCISAETTLSPFDLLDSVKQIETSMGRKAGRRWGPRLIDIDILLYADRIVREPHLTIPHAFLAKRAFVLVPLAEIAPSALDPVTGDTIASLLDAVDASGVTKRPHLSPGALT